MIRDHWDKSRVALISGGESGHEPRHAGFVGEGMLTAAVCGEVFASPSVDAERAWAFGLKVNMVIVDEDIALPDLPNPRSVAGTLFVHKIAGGLAEGGASLDEMTKAAEGVIARTKSLGMSLDTCTVPGSPKEHRIAAGKAELGLGIHGEAGVEQIDYTSAKQAMDAVADKLAQFMEDVPHVALLNNLGGASVLEMSIIAYELARTSIARNISFIVGPATLMTSLDMRGFSVSVLPATEAEIQLLTMACPMSVWPGCNEIKPVSVLELPDGLPPIKPLRSEHQPTATLVQPWLGHRVP